MDKIVHIFWQDGFYGVNAREDDKWLGHDDAFYSLEGAIEYARELAKQLGTTKFYCEGIEGLQLTPLQS